MLQRLKLLSPIWITILALFCIELALEFRHYRHGWETPIFGVPAGPDHTTKTDKRGHAIYGPVEGFPFRSKILVAPKGDQLRLWIASSSHAEHNSLPVGDIFPNRVCSALGVDNCAVINGSKAGMGIDQNIALLDQYAATYKPDYVLLYQSSLVIEGQQKRMLISKENSSSGQNSIIDFSAATRLFERTSLYRHLTEYIGGNIKLQGPLKAHLPLEMDRDFDRQIMKFIDSVRGHGSKPILITFAASHNSKNLNLMDRSAQTNFVRYTTYLSGAGWISTIEHYNQLIRNIGLRENVPIIDLERELHGQREYFVDLVHFTVEGHALAAEFFGKQMKEILIKEDCLYGI